MRITVDLDEATLKELAKITGERKKSPAVAMAVEEFVKRRKAREFGLLLREGAFAEAFDEDCDPSRFDG